jgi:hypothetical protein
LSAIFAAVFLLIYLPVIELEEQHLRTLFPDYAAYAKAVPALWPKFSRIPQKNPHPFRKALYLRNQEYQAAGGFLLALLLLIWKLM